MGIVSTGTGVTGTVGVLLGSLDPTKNSFVKSSGSRPGEFCRGPKLIPSSAMTAASEELPAGSAAAGAGFASASTGGRNPKKPVGGFDGLSSDADTTASAFGRDGAPAGSFSAITRSTGISLVSAVDDS
jgi:hypothetical protein